MAAKTKYIRASSTVPGMKDGNVLRIGLQPGIECATDGAQTF
jgi:hypothetical protein